MNSDRGPAHSARVEGAANAIVASLRETGHRAYWAGGAVRDRLLGTPRSDIDVATSAHPEQVIEMFPEALLVGKSFGVVLIPREEGHFEVATFREDGLYLDGRHPEQVAYADSPEVDCLRRDFTCNALYYDPIEDRILDHVGGQEDIRNRLLRAVGDPLARFREDRLRLLRAIRFAAQLDFTIETNTWDALREEASRIGIISPERIRDELLRILVQPRREVALRLLRDSGLLGLILPEVERMQGVEQPPEYHPEGDVFVHTLLVLSHLEHPSQSLALAALFHDVGKPPTFEIADRIRFNGHDKIGAEMFEAIARRLRLPNKLTERVSTLIAQHMRIGHIDQMRPAKRKRFLREPYFPELLELHRADCLGSHAELDLYDYCLEELRNTLEEKLKPEPFIDGKDLIAMGLRPGPLFGKILGEVEDLQLENRLENREQALHYVRDKWPPEKQP
jgi:poly(A) polymerase